jgi:membrane dipeptidase
MPQPLIVDAHEDLAYNMLNFGRDYTRSAEETRRTEQEAGSQAVVHNGETLLGWPDYQRGRVAVVFSTLFVSPLRLRLGEWDQQFYGTIEEGHRRYSAQLDAYHALEDRASDMFRLVGSRQDLADVLTAWKDPTLTSRPVGLVPLMEGAEGVGSPAELEDWWQRGVRIIGPAWAGNRFCGGTREPGALTDEGRLLLEEMAAIGFTLDLSHMDAQAAHQALDLYQGAVIASHANAAALIPNYEWNRHLQDDLIRSLVERDGVIGVIPYCRFLDYGWKRGDSRERITLQTVAAHVDHICQMAGNARHVGLGSDFDGGFGLACAPADVDTISDLQKLGPILAAKGYNDDEVAAILGGNWLRHLEEHLPA